MTSSAEAFQFAHRANIARYRKILATYLTDQERRFVEHRLAEEQTALQEFSASIGPEFKLIHAAQVIRVPPIPELALIQPEAASTPRSDEGRPKPN
jgi:hypothetical protein